MGRPQRAQLVCVLHPAGARASIAPAVIEQMAARGIATRPYLPAIHLQPPYRERYGYGPGLLPVTERVSISTLALPFFVDLPDEDVDYVVESLAEVLAEA